MNESVEVAVDRGGSPTGQEARAGRRLLRTGLLALVALQPVSDPASGSPPVEPTQEVQVFEERPGRGEARSGLFDESAPAARDGIANYGWFAFGSYVLVGLLFGAACGAIAVGRSLAPWPWFFGGLLLNGLAMIFLLTRSRGDGTTSPAGVPEGLRKVPTTRAPIPCPSCAAPTHPAARRCSRCRAALSPIVRAEAGK